VLRDAEVEVHDEAGARSAQLPGEVRRRAVRVTAVADYVAQNEPEEAAQASVVAITAAGSLRSEQQAILRTSSGTCGAPEIGAIVATWA